MGNRGRPASLRALCQAVFTLRMCVLGSCGLKKTYSETPLVTAPHSWSSDLTNAVIGKTRRPAAVLDWVTVIVDSSKSMSDHLSLRRHRCAARALRGTQHGACCRVTTRPVSAHRSDHSCCHPSTGRFFAARRLQDG